MTIPLQHLNPCSDKSIGMRSRALDRYYSILAGDSKPRYLESKGTRVATDLAAPVDELWRSHKTVPKGSEDWGIGLLELKVELADTLRSRCTICERRCGARRAEGEKGHCGVLEARIASEFLHTGEEPDLVPSYTIFFAGCTFDCVFCQNADISTHPEAGAIIDPRELARMIEVRAGHTSRRGHGREADGIARNVNWVGGDPSSDLHFILLTLNECEASIPQVWNSNMYLTEEAMSLLDGVVDLYLTDFKYGNDSCAARLSNVHDYMRIMTRNHIMARKHAEMIIRHLVLPGHVECCTRPALSWIASNLEDVKVNVMAQYRPEHRALEYPELSRALKISEYQQAMRIAGDLGLDLVE